VAHYLSKYAPGVARPTSTLSFGGGAADAPSGPTDEGDDVDDGDGDDDEGEMRGSGPRFRRSTRSVAPTFVHTGEDGEKTLAATATKATREGPRLILVLILGAPGRSSPAVSSDEARRY